MKKTVKFISVVMSVVMLFCCACVNVSAADALYETPYENSQWFTSGDYTLHYRTIEPDGNCVGQIMLLHGFGMSGASMAYMADYYVEAGYKCVLVDLPNHGYSTRETAKMQLVARETLVEQLMAELGGTWILGGHSMGGGVAVNVAVNNPETVTALMLYCPQTSMAVEPPMDAFMRSFIMTGMFETIISVGTRIGFIMDIVVDFAMQDDEYVASYDATEIVAPLHIKGTGAGLAVMSSHAMGPDYEMISAMETPVLVVKGDADNIADENNLNSLCEALTDEQSVVISGGHMIIQTKVEEVAQATLDFLA